MRRKKILFVIFILILVGLIGCSNTSKETKSEMEVGDIYGQVLFPEDGVNILSSSKNIGRTVVYLDNEKCQVTDTNGNFVFNNVEQGTHNLRIEDKYYYSDEYQVEVKDSSIETDLKAKIGGLYLKSWYLDGDLVLTLKVNLPSEIVEKVKSNECKLKVFRITDKEEVLIEAYKDDYWLSGSVFVEDEFNLNEEYEIKVKVLNSKEEVEKQFTKKIMYHKLKLVAPKDSVTKASPIFNWEKTEGVVTYDFNLSYWDKANSYWSSLSTLNSSDLTDTQYSLEVADRDKEKWTTGNDYRWYVKGYLYDKAGHCYEECESVKIEFSYK